MSFKNYFKKYTGLVNEGQALQDYYTQVIDSNTIQPGQTIQGATTTSTGTLTTAGLRNAYQTMKTSSLGGTFSGYGTYPWTDEEKEKLIGMEMTYDPKTKLWKMSLTVDIMMTEQEGIMAFSPNNGRPIDMLISKLKHAKKQLLESLTAKIILAELVKPREITK